MDPDSKSSTTEGLPVAPALGPSLEAAHIPRRTTPVDRRVVQVIFIAVLIALVAGVVARGLTHLIDLITILPFMAVLQ